ncbi:hypothetical protein D3C78_1302020 [compost metagenome]
MPCSFWNRVPVAPIDPPDRAVEPPRFAIFSSTTTFAPFSKAEPAAARPVPPPPITTTSAVNSDSVFALSSVTAAALRASTSPPACLTQSSTAAKIAFDELEAPDTTSTAKVCPSTICCGIRSNGTSLNPSVS